MTQERTNLIAVIVIWLAILVAVLFIDTPSTRWWMLVIGAAATGVVLIRMVLDRRRNSQGSVN